MGEELKESKFYFKTSKDNSEWNELKEIENVDINFKEPEYSDYTAKQIKTDYELDESERMVFGFVANAEYAFEFKLDSSLEKQWKKLAGLSPLSKKRTRKLLMAHGFDRDSAQMYADTMYPRNMNAIKELIEFAENSGI